MKAKYPQINLVKAVDGLDKLLAAGTPPDLVLVSNPGLATILEANIPEDLNPMIKTYGINIGQMEQSVVQQVQKLSDQKAFYGMPFAMNYGAMVYNQDIFDKFGVAYPKEGITYDELLELGKKLTRTDAGTNYIGVMPPDLRQMYWQYGVPVFDKASGKSKLTTDQHAQVFALLKQFYAIPGYLQNGNHSLSTDLFFKEQRMAIYPNWIAAINTYFTKAGTKDAFKWDLTTHPRYSDKPGLGKEVDFHMVVVNKSSKYREAAYQVLVSLLSVDMQTKLSKAGRLSVLKNDEIRKVYGSDNDVYKGKNLQSIFKVTPSPLPEASKYDPKINALLTGEVVKNVMVNGTDINTALRNAEDKANKEIVIP
ncbi:ABC transporter substrate-binding protein [Paenibacillus ginsengarvi]